MVWGFLRGGNNKSQGTARFLAFDQIRETLPTHKPIA
jgi:hypothetical protein